VWGRQRKWDEKLLFNSIGIIIDFLLFATFVIQELEIMDWYKINKVLGLSDEGIEKIRDFFWNVSRLKVKLSKDDKALCRSWGISERLAKIVKSHSVSEIVRLPSVDNEGNVDFDNPDDGICAFYVRKDIESLEEIHRVIYRNKQRYQEKGYNLFYFQGNQYEENYMALVRNKTDVDLLRWSKTNGINHDIDNADVIAKIEEWQRKYDFVLWGCDRDWLHLFFIHEQPQYDFQLGASNKKYYKKYNLWKERTPKFKDFAKEVIEFCPDAIHQIYGSKTKLIKAMEQMNGVYLWWD